MNKDNQNKISDAFEKIVCISNTQSNWLGIEYNCEGICLECKPTCKTTTTRMVTKMNNAGCMSPNGYN